MFRFLRAPSRDIAALSPGDGLWLAPLVRLTTRRVPDPLNQRRLVRVQLSADRGNQASSAPGMMKIRSAISRARRARLDAPSAGHVANQRWDFRPSRARAGLQTGSF